MLKQISVSFQGWVIDSRKNAVYMIQYFTILPLSSISGMVAVRKWIWAEKSTGLQLILWRSLSRFWRFFMALIAWVTEWRRPNLTVNHRNAERCLGISAHWRQIRIWPGQLCRLTTKAHKYFKWIDSVWIMQWLGLIKFWNIYAGIFISDKLHDFFKICRIAVAIIWHRPIFDCKFSWRWSMGLGQRFVCGEAATDRQLYLPSWSILGCKFRQQAGCFRVTFVSAGVDFTDILKQWSRYDGRDLEDYILLCSISCSKI